MQIKCPAMGFIRAHWASGGHVFLMKPSTRGRAMTLNNVMVEANTIGRCLVVGGEFRRTHRI